MPKRNRGGLRRFDIKLLEQLNRRKRILDIMQQSIEPETVQGMVSAGFSLNQRVFFRRGIAAPDGL